MTQPIPVSLISEEPVASVLRVLALEESGDDLFTGCCLPQVRRVYGGQVLAQSLLAASATVPEGRLPHSFHAYFVRGGNPDEVFSLQVTRVLDGRSFTNRQVTCSQDGREILTMNVSFQVTEDGPLFTSTPPEVPTPESLPSVLEIFRTMDHPVGRFLGKTAAFDVRHVGQHLYMSPDPVPSSTQQLWMRPRFPIPDASSQYVHRAMAAYVVDQIMMEPAMRALGLSWMTPGMVAASLDHAMYFHRDIDINQWLLFDQSCSHVSNGRALTRVRIFTPEGTLVAEAQQQMMLRIPTAEGEGSTRWSFGIDPATGTPLNSMA